MPMMAYGYVLETPAAVDTAPFVAPRAPRPVKARADPDTIGVPDDMSMTQAVA